MHSLKLLAQTLVFKENPFLCKNLSSKKEEWREISGVKQWCSIPSPDSTLQEAPLHTTAPNQRRKIKYGPRPVLTFQTKKKTKQL